MYMFHFFIHQFHFLFLYYMFKFADDILIINFDDIIIRYKFLKKIMYLTC